MLIHAQPEGEMCPLPHFSVNYYVGRNLLSQWAKEGEDEQVREATKNVLNTCCFSFLKKEDAKSW